MIPADMDEIYTLFEPHFDVRELSTIQIQGKHGPHPAIYVFMRRR